MPNRYRSAVVEIDLSALRHNFSEVKANIPEGAEVLSVVKANAYGHGEIAVARTLINEGVEQLGVAFLEEAIRLREGGINSPIVVLTGIDPLQFSEALRYQVTPVLWVPEIVKAFHEYLEINNLTCPIFIKVDTGMNRLGIKFDRFPDLCKILSGMKRFRLVCLMTHLAESEVPESQFTQKQLKLFEEAIVVATEYGLHFEKIGVSNSGAILHQLFVKGDPNRLIVRPGIMLYGSTPTPEMQSIRKLKPVMHFKTSILDIKDVKKGECIGYGCTFKAADDMKMGVLPVGYADGYHRCFSNRAEVLVGGRRVRVVGAISMDLMAIDLSALGDVKIGDEVVLLGTQGGEEITAWELAKIRGTIPYEIFCDVSANIPRIFIDRDLSEEKRVSSKRVTPAIKPRPHGR